MATVLYKSQYIEFKHDVKKNIPLNRLFVEIYVGSSPKLTRVSLADLYIVTGTKNGLPITRKLKSFAEFEEYFKKDKVYNSATATQPISHKLAKSKIKVEYKEINVPNTFDSTSIDRKNAPAKDIVPYGLKRNLTVTQATSKEDDNYLLAEVGGQQEFLKKNEIYYYNDSNERVYLDKNTDFSKLSRKEFFTKEGKIISKLYVENEYVFSKLNAKETLDAVKMTKTTYEVKESFDNGKLVVDVNTKTVKLNKYISEQKYVTVEEADETRPGKTKIVNKVAVRNFEINGKGEYIAVNIGSYTKVVKLTDVKDEKGNDITDIKELFGKSVKIKFEDGTLVETKPLTYEQVNVLYSVKKFYQKVEKEPTDQTCIRLKTGEYVKEMETIQPICYSFVKNTAKTFDAYLVRKQTATGVQNVIVEKDYFSKHGDTAEMSLSNAYKIKRTQFKNCDIIQTTSKNEEVEQCRVLKNYDETAKVFDADIENKDAVMLDEAKAFVVGYAKGLYNLDSVYHNGKLEELEKKKNRYEQTDTMYYNDNSEKSVISEQISIKDGKAVGGPKFSIKRANKNALKNLWRFFGYAIGPAIAAALLFLPIGGPVLPAALTVGTIVATPFIPVVNSVIGLFKNSSRIKFKDKTKQNRKSRVKQIHKETELLYERMTNDKVYVPLTERQFLEQFSLLENEIISLAATSVDNGFEVKDGIATVNAGNINKAKKFKNEYNKEEKQLEKLSKEVSSANESYKKLKEKVEKFKDAGKVVPSKLQAKFNKAKQEKDLTDKKYDELKKLHQSKFYSYKSEPDFYEADKSMNKNLRIAKEMRTVVYIKKFPDSPIVKEFLSKLSDKEKEMLQELKFDMSNGISLGEWKLNAKKENVEKYSERDEEYKKAWVKVQTEISALAETIEQQHNPGVTVETVPSVDETETPEPKVETKVKAQKTRLSKKTLEELLNNVEEMAKLDKLYMSSDEDIPGDIDEQIANIEQAIEKDKHLLKKAMESSTNAYHVYKERIIDAEKTIKKHKISYNNKKNIRITV